MKKLTLKSITTAILVATMLVTSVNTSYVTTVNAATLPTYDGNTISMKPGDTIKLFINAEENCLGVEFGNHTNAVENCKILSSDKNIVKAYSEFASDTDFTECLELIAVNSGEATITLTCMYDKRKIDIPVKVELPTATAKQKKCKHKYKTTKKATCERTGIKTCKKCKYQKELKMLPHNYVDTKVIISEPAYIYYVRQCNHSGITEDGRHVLDCSFKVKVKMDLNGNILPDSEYKTEMDIVKAFGQHTLDMGTASHNANCYTEYEEASEEQVTREVTKTICKNCGKEENK